MNDSIVDPLPSSDPDVVVVESVAEIQDLTRQSDSILAVGNRSKPPLAKAEPKTTLFSTSALRGITEYEPSEFTFTACAGTTIQEIDAALCEKQQYLPFDPLLRREGATLGGTLAAGFSGPGRHRFGGVRDFVLGVEFVTGDGELIHAGGKVVKNAAGFDIPKLLVGSCGRLGAITSLTFKVFPKPTEFHSYSLQCDSHSDATSLIAKLSSGRWELDAIDYRGERRKLWIRLGGPKSVCDRIVEDIRDSIGQPSLHAMSPEQSEEFWGSLSSLAFGGKDRPCVARLPMNLDQLASLAQWCDERSESICFHSSVAGANGWLAFRGELVGPLNDWLLDRQLCGQLIRGTASPNHSLLIGHELTSNVAQAVKQAMDPPGRFPGFCR